MKTFLPVWIPGRLLSYRWLPVSICESRFQLLGNPIACSRFFKLFHSISATATIKSENCNFAAMERDHERRLIFLQTLRTGDFAELPSALLTRHRNRPEESVPWAVIVDLAISTPL
jgi:hypothetical protein